jgi:hypothetical protein
MLHKSLDDIVLHVTVRVVPASVRTQLERVCAVSSNGTPCHPSSLLTLFAQNISSSVEKVGLMSATAVALHKQAVGFTFLRQAYRRSSLHMAGMTFAALNPRGCTTGGDWKFPSFVRFRRVILQSQDC